MKMKMENMNFLINLDLKKEEEEEVSDEMRRIRRCVPRDLKNLRKMVGALQIEDVSGDPSKPKSDLEDPWTSLKDDVRKERNGEGVIMLVLTNGKQRIKAIEWERCEKLRRNELAAGRKIEFRETVVRENVILMTDETIHYLGGCVKSVEDEWRAKRDATMKSKWRAWMNREDFSAGPPSFQPFSQKQLLLVRKEKLKHRMTIVRKHQEKEDSVINSKLRDISISARDRAQELIRKDQEIKKQSLEEKKKEKQMKMKKKKKKKKNKTKPPIQKNQTITEPIPTLLRHGFAELSNSEGLVKAKIVDIKLLDLHTACVEPQLRLCLEDTSARRRKIEATCSIMLRNMLLSIRAPETALEVKQSVHGRKRIQARCESLRVALSRAPPQYFDMRRSIVVKDEKNSSERSTTIKREAQTKYTVWNVTASI